MSTTSRAADWLEAERANLHAAAEYAAVCGRPQHTIAITAAMSGFLRAYGYWDQDAALHQTTLVVARQAGDRAGQADALTQLGILHGVAGDDLAAAACHRQAMAIYRDIGDRLGQARALNYLGEVQSLTADYPAAAASETEALALARDVGDQAVQADALIDLGSVQR